LEVRHTYASQHQIIGISAITTSEIIHIADHISEVGHTSTLQHKIISISTIAFGDPAYRSIDTSIISTIGESKLLHVQTFKELQYVKSDNSVKICQEGQKGINKGFHGKKKGGQALFSLI